MTFSPPWALVTTGDILTTQTCIVHMVDTCLLFGAAPHALATTDAPAAKHLLCLHGRQFGTAALHGMHFSIAVHAWHTSQICMLAKTLQTLG